MGEPKKPRGSLKAKVHRRTYPFATGGALLLAWANLGMPSNLDDLVAASPPKRIISAASFIAMLLVGALDALPGADLKARIVFGRWRNPLPGSRAFEKANLDSDVRIDRERLREAVGGTFPRGAREQNTAWYRLYQLWAEDARVEHVHFQWLLYRDLTWLALLLLGLGLVAAAVNTHARATALVSAVLAAVLVIFFRAAASQHAVRFCNTVLALASTAPDKKSED
jgi:hypothetical protein